MSSTSAVEINIHAVSAWFIPSPRRKRETEIVCAAAARRITENVRGRRSQKCREASDLKQKCAKSDGSVARHGLAADRGNTSPACETATKMLRTPSIDTEMFAIGPLCWAPADSILTFHLGKSAIATNATAVVLAPVLQFSAATLCFDSEVPTCAD
jgi:hypothetical protein